MSKSLKLATVCLALSVGFAVAYWTGYQTGKSANPSTDTEQATLVTPDAPVLAQTTEPQSGVEQPSPRLATNDPDDVDPASIDWAAIRERHSRYGFDTMLARLDLMGWADDRTEYSDKEIEAFNALHVVRLNPVVQQECKLIENKFFPNEFNESCKPVRMYPDHPYSELEIKELEELAWNDAEAAVFASQKAERVDDRVAFAFRAAALSGKSGPLMTVAAKEFVSLSEVKEGREVPLVRNIVSRIVLERIAQKLGDPRANPTKAQQHIGQLTNTEAQREEILRVVEDATRAALEIMAEIQQGITGSTQMQELLDG